MPHFKYLCRECNQISLGQYCFDCQESTVCLNECDLQGCMEMRVEDSDYCAKHHAEYDCDPLELTWVNLDNTPKPGTDEFTRFLKSILVGVPS